MPERVAITGTAASGVKMSRMRATGSPSSTASPSPARGSSSPDAGARTKQSSPGMVNSGPGRRLGTSPSRMPRARRKLPTPRRAIWRVSGVVVPPPASSVVTKGLPIPSTTPSSSPAGSGSRNRTEYGAAKASRSRALSAAAVPSPWDAANGRNSSVRPPEWRSRTASARGNNSSTTNAAMRAVGPPSLRPGNTRFMFAPSSGDVRRPASTAGGLRAGITITRPVTALASSVDNRSCRTIGPSNSSPWLPAISNAVGPGRTPTTTDTGTTTLPQADSSEECGTVKAPWRTPDAVSSRADRMFMVVASCNGFQSGKGRALPVPARGHWPLDPVS